jgi:hypothetical protein
MVEKRLESKEGFLGNELKTEWEGMRFYKEDILRQMLGGWNL